MNNFILEFQKFSRGKFPDLKFRDAEFFQNQNLIVVNFLVSTYKIKTISDEQKKEILEIVKKIIPDLKVKINFVKAYADEKIVTAKVFDFFQKVQPHIFQLLSEDCLKVDVNEIYINLELSAVSSTFRLLEAMNTSEKLQEHLNKFFVETINIEIKEIEEKVEIESIDDTKNKIIDDNLVYVQGARHIKLKVGKKMFSQRKIDDVNSLPTYIADVENPTENITLCGKVCEISEREYKNKKYDPTDPKSTEMKTMFKWRLTDTTGNIECVAFPNAKKVEELRALSENMQIVCNGKISESNYQGRSLSFMVSTIYLADIDYSSIKEKQSKPAPRMYKNIFPKEYSSISFKQDNIFELSERKTDNIVPSMLKNKSFVIFDTETTGLDTSTAMIIELAAVKMVDGQIVESWETLINPKMPIPETSKELTGIDDEMVQFEPDSDAVIPDFFKFTRECALVAHNINYDFPILNRHAKEVGYIFENDLFDTLALARQAFPYLKKYKLEFLSEHFGLLHENAHRAMSDVLATAELFKLIAKEMDKKNGL